MFNPTTVHVCQKCSLKISELDENWQLWMKRHCTLHEYETVAIQVQKHNQVCFYLVKSLEALCGLMDCSMGNCESDGWTEEVLRKTALEHWKGEGWYFRDTQEAFEVYRSAHYYLDPLMQRVAESEVYLASQREELEKVLQSMKQQGVLK